MLRQLEDYCIGLVCLLNPWDDDDDDDSSTQTEEETQPQETSSSHSEVDLSVERVPERGEQLPADFDPYRSLVANFDRRRRCLSENILITTTSVVHQKTKKTTNDHPDFLASSYAEVLLLNAREKLSQVGSQAHDARRNLVDAISLYERAIANEERLEERADMIAELQAKMHDLGVSVREDYACAKQHLSVARNPLNPMLERLNAYQIALIHTNESDENGHLMREYDDFCRRHRQREQQ